MDHKPGAIRISERARELKKEYQSLGKANKEDALDIVMYALPALTIDIHDFLISCPYFQPHFSEQLCVRLETNLLIGEDSSTADPELAITRELLEAFDPTSHLNIQKVCMQVPEIVELQQRLDQELPVLNRALMRIMRWLNALVLKNRLAEDHDLKEALDELIETIDELIGDVKNATSEILTYHTARGALIKHLRKTPVLDTYFAMIYIDCSRIKDIHDSYLSITEGFLILNDQLSRRLSVLQKVLTKKSSTKGIYY